MFRPDGSTRRDITNPRSKSSRKSELSAAKRGMLGVQFSEDSSKLRRQEEAQKAAAAAVKRSREAKIASQESELRSTQKRRETAGIAAIEAEDKIDAKYTEEEMKEFKVKMDKSVEHIAAAALLEAPEELAALLHESPKTRKTLQNSAQLAAIRATRLDIVQYEKYAQENIDKDWGQ